MKPFGSAGAGALLSENMVMDEFQELHRKKKRQGRNRRTPRSFLLFFHESPPTSFTLNRDIYL